MPELTVEHHPVLPSTNERCLERARDGAPAGTLIVADAQTEGRGQRGHRWASPPRAGIYASLLVRPRIPADRSPTLTLAAGLALARVLEPMCPGRLGLKWPNDLLVAEAPAGAPEAELAGKKLAGILVEGSVDGAGLHYAVIGFGLNLRGSPGRALPQAISLETLTGRPLGLDPHALAASIASATLAEVARLERGEGASVVEDWTRHALGVGGEVILEHGPTGAFPGVFRGLDPESGAPLVEAPETGEIRAFPHARMLSLEPRLFPVDSPAGRL